ncbi:MAG: hypothetical protein JXA52_04230, partial [Planctomycetes bacterium]|nr:hypothetical protein [Planctomycetota bacterium]
VLQARPDLDFVVGQYNYFIDSSELPEPRLVKGLPPLTLQSYFQRQAQIHVVAPLFRRESLRRVGPSDERLTCCDETNFFGRVLAMGLKSEYTPGAYGWYRMHHRNMRRTIDWQDRLRSGVYCFSGICEVAEKFGTEIPVELRLSMLTSRSRLRALEGDRTGALEDLQESLRILPQKNRKRKIDLKMRYWLLRIAGEKAYTKLTDNLRKLSGKGYDRLPGRVRRKLADNNSPEEIS